MRVLVDVANGRVTRERRRLGGRRGKAAGEPGHAGWPAASRSTPSITWRAIG